MWRGGKFSSIIYHQHLPFGEKLVKIGPVNPEITGLQYLKRN